MQLSRRSLLLTPLALGACALLPQAERTPPILFVHGNGDSAAIWHTTIWRFESNDWPRERLAAVDFPHPLARGDNAKPQDNRSSTAEQTDYLLTRIDALLAATQARKLVLVGSSRGGYPIRDAIKIRGAAAKVSHAILCGVPNHGVWAGEPALGSEFNGAGPYLTQLNAGGEVHPDVRFLTIRSDKSDKYAFPDGRFIGRPGQATNVGHDAPALDGAVNVVLDGLDHREVAFSAAAFREMHKFLTAAEPRSMEIAPETTPLLNGKVTGFANGGHTNLPLTGATVEVYRVGPATGARLGPPVHRQVTGEDGHWGAFTADPLTFYEFAVEAPGYPTTHFYRSPFPRASHYVQLRLAPIEAKDKAAGAALVVLTRPQGYFGHGRDTFLIDGKVPPGISEGVPAVSQGKMSFAELGRSVPVQFNRERMTALTWPLAQDHISIAELHD